MMLFIAIGVVVVCIVLVSVALVKSLQPVTIAKQEGDALAIGAGKVAINIINASQNDSINKNIENGGALNDSR